MADRKGQESAKNIDDIPRSEIERIIDEWIRNEVYREILKRRLLDGITYERLAEEFDLSSRHVKNIVYKCMQKICIHL